jgi:hypothetical protein
VEASAVQEAFAWFKRQDSIELSPPFQRRGNLWPVRAKAFLIDSMINGFDVPKLYIADLALLPRELRVPGKSHAVIDGRQRFETLFEWFSGDFKLNEDFTYRRNPLIDAAGSTHQDLSREFPELAAAVERFPLDVMNVVVDRQDEINQLFIRLNQSVPLTGAETRNAMEGDAPEIIRDLAEHPFFTDRIAFSVKRGGDLNTAAKILLMESAAEFVDVKRRRLDKFVEDLIAVSADADLGPEGLQQAARSVVRVLNDMADVFHSRDPLLKSQGQTPVYYWFVREVGPRDSIRPFLEQFEASRKRNRELVEEVGTSGEEVDLDLLRYDQLNRSVNDQHSIRGRYEILRRRYSGEEAQSGW